MVDKEQLGRLHPKKRIEKLEELRKEQEKQIRQIDELIEKSEKEAVTEEKTNELADEITPEPRVISISELFNESEGLEEIAGRRGDGKQDGEDLDGGYKVHEREYTAYEREMYDSATGLPATVEHIEAEDVVMYKSDSESAHDVSNPVKEAHDAANYRPASETPRDDVTKTPLPESGIDRPLEPQYTPQTPPQQTDRSQASNRASR